MSDETSNLNDNPIPSSEMELYNQDDSPEEISRHGEQLESRPIDQELTFNPWLVVDIIGSPGLTGLIGALTLDLCEGIPSLDLSAESSEESEDVCKLLNLDESCNSIATCEAQNQQPLKTVSRSVSFSIATLPTNYSEQNQRQMPGPLDELYPFPRPAQPKKIFKNPRTDHLVSGYSLKMKELECRARFKVLKSMERSEIIKLVDEMRSIAWRHYEIDQFGPAETWWRRVVTCYLETPGYGPFKVLHACLHVIINVQCQGRYKEAFSLHQTTHHKIMQLVEPNHELAMLSADRLAILWNNIGEFELAMAIRRDLLQISILHFGTRSTQTLSALQSLGPSLESRGQYCEAETILSILIELDYEIFRYEDRGAIDIHNDLHSRFILARVLNKQRKYEDSKSLLHYINGCFKDLIQPEKWSCSQYFLEKARVLKFEGRLRESEEILRAILKHRPNYPGVNVTITMMELADILMEAGQQEEGTTLWENIFFMDVEIFGIEHKYSMYDCEKLGFYYANQGRYDDAILHYQLTKEQLVLSKVDNPDTRDDCIRDIQGWIAEVEEMKREDRGEKIEVQLDLQTVARDLPGMIYLKKG